MCMRYGEVLYAGANGLFADALRKRWGERDPKTLCLIEDWMSKIAGKPVPAGFNTCDWLLYQAQAQGERN